MTHNPNLQFKNYAFTELFHAEGLARLDRDFLAFLDLHHVKLRQALEAYRSGYTLQSTDQSELLIEIAKVLEAFLIDFFTIEAAATKARAETISYNPIADFKKEIVLRRARKQLQQLPSLPAFAELDQWLNMALLEASTTAADKELAVALLAKQYLSLPEQFQIELEKLTAWSTHALATPEAQDKVQGWTSFRLPERTDYSHLIAIAPRSNDSLPRLTLATATYRQRDGFTLTETPMEIKQVQDEVNYCIYCHDHQGDFCSKGFPVKKNDPTQGFKTNPLDNLLVGCPLEEKISEMQLLKRDGYTIAALAMVMVDNPMCPATGHRICNDCMKACIYQKQTPVNIPQIETRVLLDVLNLPWGVEIYDLLTRWNPLRCTQWIMKPYNGLKVLIAGMGPAGFTLAHHLLMEGFAVVGFDGLKLEPLTESLVQQPVYCYDDIKESLAERVMAGFGGVAEYGITVRWDKNFLKLIYLSLLRRPYFQAFGSVRFGGTLEVEDAWEMGFDHLAIAVGAGLSKALPIPGSLAPGMRQANDFLMALQLNGAAKKHSLANLQVRLPAVIIGGGLTGVDTATEVQAYYVIQVEKILTRYETLITHYGEKQILAVLDIPSQEILAEFLSHGQAIRQERLRAHKEQELPNFVPLLQQWGGVTIVYRRHMQDSPAYLNNHEELAKALAEGVFYAEALEPIAIDLNQHGHVEALVCHHRMKRTDDEWETTTTKLRIPARSIFAATGIQPNIAYEFEHRGTFTRHGLHYQHYEDEAGQLVLPHGILHCKETAFGPFTSYQHDYQRVSLIGDTHPVFHGNVVKAIASGMRTYPKILQNLSAKLDNSSNPAEYQHFVTKMRYWFQATVIEVKRCHPTILELTVVAPLASKHFQPGQFYRLQNYETHAARLGDTVLQIEPLALFAIERNGDQLRLMVLEQGVSSKLCATLAPGDPVALMGPTGVRSKISTERETVLIIADHLNSLAFVRAYGKAARAAGNRVIYLSYFQQASLVYCQDELETCCDLAIWASRDGNIPARRPQDYSTTAEPLEALLLYAAGHLTATKNQPEIPLCDIDRIYVIGSSHLLRCFQQARKNQLKPLLIKDPYVLGSVYGPMQCMLKGVCAQCLQWQIDPETGQRTKAVFACSWQEQPLELIDIGNLDERQAQNSLQEQLSMLWLNYLQEHLSSKLGV